MTSAQIYCTLQEVIDDLRLNGDEPGLISRIQAASRFINRRFGDFIPVTGTHKYNGTGPNIQTAPLLSITSITDENSNAVTDYDAYPMNRHWENGPYTRIYYDYLWDAEEISIVGKWGKWDETEALGITGSQAAANTANLVVTNGSLLSPGMVLLIETEQELVTSVGSPTAATSLVNGAIAITAESITVDNGAEFNEGEVIQISTEDMYIRGIVGDVLWVARGWNQTTKATHLDDSAIAVYRTFNTTRGVNGTTAAIHSSKAISKYLVPSDINYLCRQIAALMRSKAASGFAGKVGNSELGETFYFNEFPGQVKEIQRNYRIVTL